MKKVIFTIALLLSSYINAAQHALDTAGNYTNYTCIYDDENNTAMCLANISGEEKTYKAGKTLNVRKATNKDSNDTYLVGSYDVVTSGGAQKYYIYQVMQK